jgi:hypothetical protein
MHAAATEDLISTIQISPSPPSATRSARRPDSRLSSATQDKPSASSSRWVPRATAIAVSDWRPSAGTVVMERNDIAAGFHAPPRRTSSLPGGAASGFHHVGG